MGFSNSVLAALKKLGCVSEPRVQETKYATLPPYQAEEVEAVQGRASDIHVIDQRKEKDDSKIITVEDRSSSKPEEEKPKSDKETATTAELIKEEGESKSNQAPAPTTVPSQLTEEEQIARKVDAN
ncbi:hypothetical protein Ddye_002669 [Dipteronia dyeriana]|uniref:Uncharacterized protein n=1 Tax=Dipteronia dyeriana TaxID=168575 RepID=A0AAD9XR90_9ROSI|nr:hypothetical protein Ddye_002669 [Dipteronia dyeriana]